MLCSRPSLVLTLLLSGSVTAAPAPDAHAYSTLILRAPMTPAHKAAAVQVLKQVKNKLRPQPNQVVFWSGMTTKDGKLTSIRHDAGDYAKANGKETIHQALEKNNIKIPGPRNNPASTRLWDAASKIWAFRSKGETNAILEQRDY